MKKLLLITFIALCSSLLNASAQIISTSAGNGTFGFSGDGGQATAAEMYYPNGVAADGAGNIYIADYNTNRIRVVNMSGVISTFAGNGINNFSGDGGQATAAELFGPDGIAADGAGNIYVADDGNYRIRVVNTSGVISTIAGNGNAGFSGDGGQATAADLAHPYGIAADGSGNIYIADYNNSRIRVVNTSGIISTFPGNGIYGSSGDGGPATAAEIAPYAVAADGAGNIYIVDFSTYLIRVVNTNGIISTFAGNGILGFSCDGGPATAAEIDPYAVAADGSGNIYIADYSNSRIRVVNTSGIISTFAGNGIFGFSGDGGPATAAEMSCPNGVAADGLGNIYIADSYNYRIRVVSGIVLGIEDLSITNKDVKLFPNPNSGAFMLQVNGEKLKVNSVIEIYNVLGEKIYTAPLNVPEKGTSTTIISLMGQTGAGIYFYRITSSDNKEMYTGKFIITQ